MAVYGTPQLTCLECDFCNRGAYESLYDKKAIRGMAPTGWAYYEGKDSCPECSKLRKQPSASAGAMRAASAMYLRYLPKGMSLNSSGLETYKLEHDATIIDRETGLPELLATYKKLLAFAEDAEESIESLRGNDRSVKELEADGDLPPAILEARAAIAAAEKETP